MTASICSCLARPQYFIIPSPLTPHLHKGCVLANWIIMTQNRLCSDPVPAQAIHNGFSDTADLINVQLVSLKCEGKIGQMKAKREWKTGSKWSTGVIREIRKKKNQSGQWRKKRGLKEKQRKFKSNETGREANPRAHIQYAIQKFYKTAGQQLWPWRFWQKWFTMVTVGRQPSAHPLHLSSLPAVPHCLSANLIGRTIEMSCLSNTHAHVPNQPEGNIGMKEEGALNKSEMRETREESNALGEEKDEKGVYITVFQIARKSVSICVCMFIWSHGVGLNVVCWTTGSGTALLIDAEYRIKWILMWNQLPRGNVVCRLALLMHVPHL